MSATPDTRRHRHASRSDRTNASTSTSTNRHTQDHSRASTPPLPAYEPPIAPLNAAGHNAIIALLNSQSLRQLKKHIQLAEEKLTDAAGEVNESLTDARVRYQKERARKRKRANGETPAAEGVGEKQEEEEEGDDDDDGEEINRLARLEEQVQSVTEELEARMRQTIDAEVKLEGLKGVLADMAKEAEEATIAGAGAGGRRGRRARRRRGDDEEDQDPEEDDDEDYEATPEAQMTGIPPSRRLDQKLSEESAQWTGQSLTQRYSTNNAYVGFYRIVHDAKHPGDDIPPLPHASTWFAHMEDPHATSATADQTSSRRTRQRRSASPADSDEIAIERERISLKCPLTLLPFRDPVTSAKCPHSFEREAITDMIAHSSTTVPGPPSHGRRSRIRSVKCPVCSVVLTADDLRSDAALLRRVRRAEAASQREAEDDELDADGNRRRRPREGRKSGITVASDDEDSEDRGGSRHQETAAEAVRIKQERALSQAQSTLSDVMDDDDE